MGLDCCNPSPFLFSISAKNYKFLVSYIEIDKIVSIFKIKLMPLSTRISASLKDFRA